MWDAGVTGFKGFACDLHGVEALDNYSLMKTMTTIAGFGGTLLIHCEETGICQFEEERLKADGRTDYYSQFEWRSKLAERIATKRVVDTAKETRCRTVIAHVSQPELLEIIHEANSEGYEIYSESCPHYLNTTVEDLKERGPWLKFTPPMNTQEKQDELWDAFNKGYITTIGSDHCPWLKETKEPGEKNIWDAPNGIPGVETSLKLMLNAVNNGKTTLNKIVKHMSEYPAKVYGLFPRKGQIEVGADADIVILDMDKKEVLKNENIVSKCGWTPYDGFEIQGVPESVFVRGKLIVDHQKVVGEVGYGKFVHRNKPSIEEF